MSAAIEPPFSGSYALEDCRFLLKPLRMAMVEVGEKECAIQSGTRHYSEMLSPEQAPSPNYLALFHALVDAYAERMAEDVAALAAHLAATRPAPLTVVSLARAGTPVGALLTRALRRGHDSEVRHYSISIIRDRGIDENALCHILRTDRRPAAGLFFVDGWTAKGVIGRELRRAIAKWNAENPEQLDSGLHVLSDIGGSADVAASFDDYAIPSGILNATVSGLVSRSILNERIGPRDFHGCVYYDAFAPADRSNWFLDRVAAAFPAAAPRPLAAAGGRQARAAATSRWLADCMRAHGIGDENLVKPGVAEATRVFLRRVPACLIVRDPHAFDVRHLLDLAAQREVPVEADPDLPFLAAALIRSFRGAAAPTTDIRSDEP